MRTTNAEKNPDKTKFPDVQEPEADTRQKSRLKRCLLGSVVLFEIIIHVSSLNAIKMIYLETRGVLCISRIAVNGNMISETEQFTAI